MVSYSLGGRFPGRVFVHFYNPHQKGSYRWDEKDYVAQSNRTESLDASHKEIMDEDIILPKQCEMTEEFAKQMSNVAKRLEEDPETGSKRYVYVKLSSGAGDHFRHAFNYEAIARQRVASSFFADCVFT